MLTTVQVSLSSNFPSKLRKKLRSQTQTVTHKYLGDGPITEMECPRCQNNEATWTEAQLRSADEAPYSIVVLGVVTDMYSILSTTP